VCHTSAGATVTDQAEHLSHIRRSRVTDQVVPECQASPGARHAVAGREGLEPPTTGFGDQRSTKLSYRPTVVPVYAGAARSRLRHRIAPALTAASARPPK
jgi:hypothetical protein